MRVHTKLELAATTHHIAINVILDSCIYAAPSVVVADEHATVKPKLQIRIL